MAPGPRRAARRCSPLPHSFMPQLGQCATGGTLVSPRSAARRGRLGVGAGVAARPGANGTGVALGCCEGVAAAGARVVGLISVTVSHLFLESREFSLIATKVAKLFLHFQL